MTDKRRDLFQWKYYPIESENMDPSSDEAFEASISTKENLIYMDSNGGV